MSTSPSAVSADVGHTTLTKVGWRLLPFLLLLYVVAWLDRVNIGFAALQMNADLGFSAAVYGFGAGVFFAGYALFEVPSNLVLARVGARRWIARIMITWGVISAAMMFVQSATSFYVLRFLLGVAEAGFFPGIIYYLSNWFPATQRARAVSWFMVAIPLSIVIGGPLAGLLLGMDGLLGLTGCESGFCQTQQGWYSAGRIGNGRLKMAQRLSSLAGPQQGLPQNLARLKQVGSQAGGFGRRLHGLVRMAHFQ